MKKKYIVFSVLIIVLVIALFLSREHNLMFGKSEYELLRVEDTAAIQKIIIGNKYDTLVLERYNNRWVANKNTDVNPSSIAFFLKAVNSITINTPASKTETNRINSAPPEKITTLSFELANKPDRHIVVVGANKNETGTYMKLHGAENVYLMNIPGLTGNFTSIFETDVAAWSDNTVFRFLPDNIISVEVKNLKDDTNSFRIEKQNNKYLLKNNHNEIVETPCTRQKIEQYLTYFIQVEYMGVSAGITKNKQDSILNTKAHYFVEVKTKNKNASFRLFPKYDNNQMDLNKAYIQPNNKQNIQLIKYIETDAMTKNINYFTTCD